MNARDRPFSEGFEREVTVRNLPPSVSKAVREKARKEG